MRIVWILFSHPQGLSGFFGVGISEWLAKLPDQPNLGLGRILWNLKRRSVVVKCSENVQYKLTFYLKLSNCQFNLSFERLRNTELWIVNNSVVRMLDQTFSLLKSIALSCLLLSHNIQSPNLSAISNLLIEIEIIWQ